jgi:hypothetical protein
VVRVANDLKPRRRIPARKALAVDIRAVVDLDFQPVGKRVDDRGADAVQAAGDLVPPPPNFPPACSMVKTTVTAGIPTFGWMPTGMPRPLSVTRTISPGRSSTVICVQKPASASSMELSTIS